MDAVGFIRGTPHAQPRGESHSRACQARQRTWHDPRSSCNCRCFNMTRGPGLRAAHASCSSLPRLALGTQTVHRMLKAPPCAQMDIPCVYATGTIGSGVFAFGLLWRPCLRSAERRPAGVKTAPLAPKCVPIFNTPCSFPSACVRPYANLPQVDTSLAPDDPSVWIAYRHGPRTGLERQPAEHALAVAPQIAGTRCHRGKKAETGLPDNPGLVGHNRYASP